MAAEQRQEVVQLEVDKILVPEERVTSVYDGELEAELEASIRQHGILQPLQVALTDGQYILIDGLHRLRVAKKLGMKTVPCIVKPLTEDQLLVTNLIMNRQRGRSNPAQEALILKKLVDEYNYDFNKAAETLGMSQATADKYYKIASNCSERVLDMMGRGMVSVGCAYWLSYLEDKSKQDELLEYIIKWGYTVEQCKSAVMSLVTPQVETPYIIMPSGEPKPRPIPVYPCGREVDPTDVVVIQFDRTVWTTVEQALKQLCSEGFFYGGEGASPTQEEEGAAEEAGEQPQQQPPQPSPGKERPRDWFLEKL